MHDGSVTENRGIDIPALLRLAGVIHHEGFVNGVFGKESSLSHGSCLLSVSVPVRAGRVVAISNSRCNYEAGYFLVLMDFEALPRKAGGFLSSVLPFDFLINEYLRLVFMFFEAINYCFLAISVVDVLPWIYSSKEVEVVNQRVN